ncbi:MAG: hypothetical protein ACK5KU_05105 [Beutenbergiaceae bacterium]
MDQFEHRLNNADPASALPPDAIDAARALAARAPALSPVAASRRISRPALTALVASGAILAGTAAATAPIVLDLWSDESPVALTVPIDMPTGTVGEASCTIFVNLVPADGQVHYDDEGQPLPSGAAEPFSQEEFDAVENFVRNHDWTVLTEGFLVTADTFENEDGNAVVQASLEGVSDIVDAELAANGLNESGSAVVVETFSCTIDEDA